MKQKEEDGLNYIYSQTYNFVYLRAKSILKNEEDIKAFMQTVYVICIGPQMRYSWIIYMSGSESMCIGLDASILKEKRKRSSFCGDGRGGAESEAKAASE